MNNVTHFYATHTEKQGVVLGGNVELHQQALAPFAALCRQNGWTEPQIGAAESTVMATNIEEDLTELISLLKAMPDSRTRQGIVELLATILEDASRELQFVDQRYLSYLDDCQRQIDWIGK